MTPLNSVSSLSVQSIKLSSFFFLHPFPRITSSSHQKTMNKKCFHSSYTRIFVLLLFCAHPSNFLLFFSLISNIQLLLLNIKSHISALPCKRRGRRRCASSSAFPRPSLECIKEHSLRIWDLTLLNLFFPQFIFMFSLFFLVISSNYNVTD